MTALHNKTGLALDELATQVQALSGQAVRTPEVETAAARLKFEIVTDEQGQKYVLKPSGGASELPPAQEPGSGAGPAGRDTQKALRNSRGESLEQVLVRYQHQGHPVDDDPLRVPIDEAEQPLVDAYAHMSTEELGAVLRQLIVNREIDALDYWYQQRTHLTNPELLVAFLDHLSEDYLNLKHHFVRAIADVKFTKSLMDDIRQHADELEPAEMERQSRRLMDMLDLGYRRRAFIREVAKRWSEVPASEARDQSVDRSEGRAHESP